jgi:O-antigen ligase
VLAISPTFLFQERYGNDDVTSGRTDTWRQVGRDWVDHGVVYKLFGDYRTSRAVVHRVDDGHRAGEKPLDLTTDNAAVGALQRGGVLGAVAFLVGLGLMLWHAVRRRAPAWFTVAAVGSLPTIATADWLLGGTGGTLWILLLAGEAWLLFGPAGQTGTASSAGGAASTSASASERSPSQRSEYQ